MLSDNISNNFSNSVAFTYSKQALGIVKQQGDEFTILPFSYIENSILNILESDEATRPYLGINFVNLASIVIYLKNYQMVIKKVY